MIGNTITHYKILEKIGSGGMGVVYKAQDLKLDRFVALKFLPPHLTTSEDEKQRFIHEAKAASSLDHNNICNIYEIDETENGQLFISMACYEGDTLDNKIKDKPLPIEEANDITIQIAQGLAKAHEKDIVHRDIKPPNIMLTSDGFVKILDFGLAKLSTQTKLTKESTTLGTVSYMSPEQAKGEEVDYRTDIWSLGVILYEMLTGQLPFKGEYESAVIYSIMNDTQEPVTGLRTGIPIELERIITKCLQKNPANRYQHIDELIVDLQCIRRHSESAGITSYEEKKKRLKSILLPIVVLSTIILIIAGYFFIQSVEKSTAEWEISIAVLPFDDLSPKGDQEWFCDGMTEQIITNLSRLQKLRVRGRNSVMQFKNVTKTIPQIAKELNVNYLIEGSVRKSENRVRVTVQLIKATDDYHLWANDYDRELDDILDVQDDISEKIASVLLEKLSPKDVEFVKTDRPNNAEAWGYYMLGRDFHLNKFFSATWNVDYFYKSEEMFLKAIELDSSYALSYAGLADLYHTYSKYGGKTEEEKQIYLELVEKNIMRAYKLNSSSSYVNRVMGSLNTEKGDLLSGFRFHKKAVELEEYNADSNYELGWFFYFLGLIHPALKYLNKAVEIDPLNPQFYGSIGLFYMDLGQFENSELNIKKALDLNPNHHNTLGRYTVFLIEMKRYNEANTMIAKFKELYPDSRRNIYFKSLMYAINGEKEKALEPYPEGNLMLYLYLGMNVESINKLELNFEKTKELDESSYLWLNNDPRLDPLRSDHRFQEILAKHKEIYEENLEKYGDIDI